MELCCVGLSHHTAPVALREQLAFPGEALGAALDQLASDARPTGMAESVLLSTCNRTEIYGFFEDGAGGEAEARLSDWLTQAAGAGASAVRPHLYARGGMDAARHLMRVAAGLDSMVLGEAEILGQVRLAAEAAERHGAAGPVLAELFGTARRAASRARHETEIAERPASVPSAAVQLLQAKLGELQDLDLLLVGAGKMGLSAARQLLASSVQSISVINRSQERAARLAAAWSGEAMGLDALPKALARADVVLCATSAPGAVIDRAMLMEALQGRSDRPLTVVDMAVPRDVAPEARGMQGLDLYDVDDLRATIDANLAQRYAAVPKAEHILETEIQAFAAWLEKRDVAPTIAGLHSWAEGLRRKELERALRRLSSLSEAERKSVEALTEALVGKLLHPPIARLKDASDLDSRRRCAEALQEIYGIDENAACRRPNARGISSEPASDAQSASEARPQAATAAGDES